MKISVDIIIFGGGIAGLWLLAQLKEQGYSALLLENQSLGQGQTILSQGIIHGGTKYAVKQQLTPLARHIKTMPAYWQACLQGTGELSLQGTKILSSHQYLWTPHQWGSRFVGFLTSKAMQSRVNKLKHHDYPTIFKNEKSEVYALNEPVLDVYSLLHVLRKKYLNFIFKIDTNTIQFHFKDKLLEKIKLNDISIESKFFIFTSGQGNQFFLKKFNLETIKTQLRPLQMLLIKHLPYPLYAHCVDKNFKPRLTITSYPTSEGYAWYFGGEIAEQGSKQEPQAVFEKGIKELKILFPEMPLKNLSWKTVYINRSEPWQENGKIPALPSIQTHHNLLFAWPIKLAYAPLLTKEIFSVIKKNGLLPSFSSSNDSLNLPKPSVAIPPWLEENQWN